MLDITDAAVIAEQDAIGDARREFTAQELMGEEIAAWLDTPVPEFECEDIKGEIPDDDDPRSTSDRPMVRNMVTANLVYVQLSDEPIMKQFRNSTTKVYGKALAEIPGWRCIGKQRRHGQPPAVWYVRGKDGPLWVPAPETPDEDTEIDDLLG